MLSSESNREFVGSWGGLPYDYPITGEDFVHPDDRENLRKLDAGGKIFQYLRTEGDYFVLRYSDSEYRVKASIYCPKSDFTPKFTFGEKVFPKNHPELIGVIRGITWHTKQQQELYFIMVGTKKISKRYWRDELEAVTSEG